MNDLNRNELEALRILWNQIELKPSELEALYSWPIDNGTLRSVLRVLQEKGLVTRRKAGKAFLYKATASQQNALSKMARRMAEVFTGGSTVGLIAQLIQSEKLSDKEIEDLKRIAERTEPAPLRRGHRRTK